MHNARAAGKVRLARRRYTRDYAIREAAPDEAGPVLKRYIQLAPSTRPYFEASKDSPVEDFAAEAERHPVFELIPAGEDRLRGHPGIRRTPPAETCQRATVQHALPGRPLARTERDPS